MRKIPVFILFGLAILSAPIARAENPEPHEPAAFDPDALFARAKTFVAAGNVADARVVLTMALIERTDFADAYALRSVTQSRMGNLATATTDLDRAKSLHADAALLQTAATELQQASQLKPAPGDPWENLRKEALSGSPFEKLVPLATALVKSENAVRVRWDELYQSRLAGLTAAAHNHPNDLNATLNLADYLYNEAEPLGEPLSPKGGMRYYRFSSGTTKREIMHADALYDQILKSDPQNVRALTGKAAMRLERDDWNEGVAFAKKALATGKPTPELLELLSRILANNAASNAYTALDLRTAKTWLTYGVGVTIMWTRQPSDSERQRSAQLDDVANELFDEADAQLEAAAKAKAGTADGAFYQGLLDQRHHDPDAALKSFHAAVQLDPHSERNRRQLAGALLAVNQTQEAVDQQEILTLQHETTTRFRLAAAWDAIDKSDFARARKQLETAANIDPTDSRVPAYLAAVATAEKKPADAAAYLQIALALEEAHNLFRAVSLTPTAAPKIVPTTAPAKPVDPINPPSIANPLNGDEAAMAILLNIRAANRYAEIKEPEKQLACLGWNDAIEKRLSPQVLASTPARAVLPDPAIKTPPPLRSVANLIAWSHVYYGHALLDRANVDPANAGAAYTIFAEIGDRKHSQDIFEPQGLCYAAQWRIKMAGTDPHKEFRATWLANAATLQVLTGDEIQVIMSRKKDQTQLARTGYADQRETMQQSQDLMDLSYFKDATPVQAGAYDPRNNSNYKGTNDHGPDDGQPLSTGGPIKKAPHPNPHSAQ